MRQTEKITFKNLATFYRGKKTALKIQEKKEIKLDLGSGRFKRKGFVCIDVAGNPDLKWNLSWGIPFKDGSVKEIYSSHFFEHLDIDTLLYVLGECIRALEEGGKFEIVVPHIDPYMKAYKKKDMRFLRKKIYDAPERYKNIYNTPFDLIMWLLYRNGEHKTFFDQDSLVSKLKLIGFKNIKERKYNSRKDLNKRYSSLYLTAYK